MPTNPLKESKVHPMKIEAVPTPLGEGVDIVLMDRVRISCFNLAHAHKLFLELESMAYIKEF